MHQEYFNGDIARSKQMRKIKKRQSNTQAKFFDHFESNLTYFPVYFFPQNKNNRAPIIASNLLGHALV